MQILYDEQGFSDYEKHTYMTVLRRNVVDAMQCLIIGAEKFEYRLENKASAANCKFIVGIDPLSGTLWDGTNGSDITRAVKQLWINEKAIKQAYQKRAQLQLLDAAEYLFENLDRISKSDYSPSRDDILRARLRTSGIVQRTFAIGGVDFQFLDVGGQRNERRKWIHCFENVTAVIFVTAVSEFDQMLYEDETVNRLAESIKVFSSIVNNKYFQQSTIVLFLNKTDLFKEKMSAKALKECFQDYDGDGSYEDGIDFIKGKFLEVNGDDTRLIFPHPTCATDTTNVSKVFEVCKLTILNNNLKKLGLG